MPGQRARPVRRAGTGRPTRESVHGVPSPTQLAPLEDTGTQLLFRLVAAAYERRSLAIGSHWAFEDWGRFLPEHTTAVSILDRPLHHATVVVTSGQSYRIRDARQRRGDTPPTS